MTSGHTQHNWSTTKTTTSQTRGQPALRAQNREPKDCQAQKWPKFGHLQLATAHGSSIVSNIAEKGQKVFATEPSKEEVSRMRIMNEIEQLV